MGGGGWPAPFDTDLEAAARPRPSSSSTASPSWPGSTGRSRGLEGFGRPDGFHERQVDRWMSHLAAVQFRDIPGLDAAAAWLRAHQPRHYEPGIMHGDYQFANVMFRHGAPARLAAIVDWEMATVGDPLLDLGWVIQGWLDDDEERSTGSYVDYTGMPSRAELLDYYATESGRDTDEIDYYVILARFKLAVVLEAGYARVVQGTADNPKMEAFGDVVLNLAERAADLAVDHVTALMVPTSVATGSFRPHRQGGARHRRQPGTGAVHGPGVRRRGCRRRRDQPQARRLPGRGRRDRGHGPPGTGLVVQRVELGRARAAWPTPPTTPSGASTCSSTTPGCPCSTRM